MFKFLFQKIKSFCKSVKTFFTALFCYLKMYTKPLTAEGYVDTGVKILIAIVIGALLLAGLYALFNTTIMPSVTQKITELFSYNG